MIPESALTISFYIELAAYPDVQEVTVIARPHEKWGERAMAYVILKDHLVHEKDRKQALREIHAEIDGKVSGYKKLRGGVWEVKSLPKNPTGKILRAKLKDERSGLTSLDRADRRVKL